MLVQILLMLATLNAHASELGTSRSQSSGSILTAPKGLPSEAIDPVMTCRLRKTIPMNSPRTVRVRSPEMCNRRFSLIFATDLDFRITKTPSGIEINKMVEYVYKGKPQNRAAVEARIENLKRCIPAFYRRYGLTLKLNFSSWSSPTPGSIEISDNVDRNDDSHWGLLSTDKTPKSPLQNCQSIAHEVGHMLGLQDHYVDQQCPDHIRGPADDIMRDPWAKNGRLYPTQIQKIIQPLCGKTL